MPGARLQKFRFGDSAELLAEFILNSLAFTTKVPRQEDVGHDLFCTLIERDNRLLRAGPFFTVQIKSNREPIEYSKEYEVEWLKHQENPFLICVVDRANLLVEIFSTWNMHNGFLYRKASKVVLVPGGPDDEYELVRTKEDRSEQIIPLGRPILQITVQDVMNQQKVNQFSKILKEWVLLDRENIVNRHAGIFWVVGPNYYETNKSISEFPHQLLFFYFNAINLKKCLINFGRTAPHLRIVMRRALGFEHEQDDSIAPFIADLEEALLSFSKTFPDHIDMAAKSALLNEVGLEI